jgi:hypothetical protein
MDNSLTKTVTVATREISIFDRPEFTNTIGGTRQHPGGVHPKNF